MNIQKLGPEEKSERLKPEQLISTNNAVDYDTPQIISPPIIIALGILGVGVSSLFVWSVTYQLPITASGAGLIYQGPQLVAVNAASGGRLTKLNTSIGSQVYKGFELATLDANKEEVMFYEAKQQQALANSNSSLASNLIPKELKQQIDSNKKQLGDTERNITQQKSILDKQLQNLTEYKKLAKNGYVSSVELLTYQEKAASLENTIGQSEAQLNSLIAKRDSNRRELANSLNASRSTLANANATAKVRRYGLQMARKLSSPINGTVVQITTWPGSVVEEGQELFVLSEKKGKLTTSFLITGSDAGRIKPGDQALISPSSAPPQRFGYIKGIVRKVSPFPTNQAAFGSLIGSQSLAQLVFASQESKLPFLVQIDPVYSNANLAWSGSSGPPWPIVSGSVAEVKVIYQSRLPITYVIPWIKNATGLSNF